LDEADDELGVAVFELDLPESPFDPSDFAPSDDDPPEELSALAAFLYESLR